MVRTPRLIGLCGLGLTAAAAAQLPAFVQQYLQRLGGHLGADERAALAIEVFAYRLAKSILGLTAALPKLDAIVFTGGIGENSFKVRAKTLDHLRVLRVEIDSELNAQNGDASTGRITKEGTLPCLVVATNEELMIARETLNITQS